MGDYSRKNPSVWDCKFHVVFFPKYRRKVLLKALRHELGEVFSTLLTMGSTIGGQNRGRALSPPLLCRGMC
jgi:hypothetical protein